MAASRQACQLSPKCACKGHRVHHLAYRQERPRLAEKEAALATCPDYVTDAPDVSCHLRPRSAILFRRLRGRMSVHTSSMYAKHSDFRPSFPTAVHPAGMGLSANQIEYCSSWFMTTLYVRVSSSSSITDPPLPLRH